MEIGDYDIVFGPACVVILCVVLFLVAAYRWAHAAWRDTRRTEFYIQRATANLRRREQEIKQGARILSGNLKGLNGIIRAQRRMVKEQVRRWGKGYKHYKAGPSLKRWGPHPLRQFTHQLLNQPY